MECLICNYINVSPYNYLYDNRYGYPGIFQITKCPKCGHKTFQKKFTPEEIMRLYSEYYPRSTFDLDQFKPYKETSGFYAWLNGDYNSAFRWVPRNVRVLDIGCGFGESLGYHRSRGCDVYGVEADENIQRVADKFGYKVHVGLFDPNLYEHDFFDYVTMDQVIEHIANPIQTLREIAQVIKPGGILVLGTPNANGWGARIFGNRWVHWHIPYHLHLFSKESMRSAATQTGFVVDYSKTITSSYWLHMQWCHLLTCPKMGEPSEFWSPKRKQRSTTKAIIKSLYLLDILKINHMLSRIFDALDLGDNYLFILRKKP